MGVEEILGRRVFISKNISIENSIIIVIVKFFKITMFDELRILLLIEIISN
jgi:hypothetical protein